MGRIGELGIQTAAGRDTDDDLRRSGADRADERGGQSRVLRRASLLVERVDVDDRRAGVGAAAHVGRDLCRRQGNMRRVCLGGDHASGAEVDDEFISHGRNSPAARSLVRERPQP